MSGRSCTYITPVYCGHALDYLTQKLPIGGQQVNDALNKVSPTTLHHTTTFPGLRAPLRPHCDIANIPTSLRAVVGW